MTGGADASLEWSELVPGGVVVYYADGDEEILHVNQYVLSLFECETFDEFMDLTGGTFRGFVWDSDVASTEDSIWGQVDKRNGLDHIYYQIRTKGGKVVTVDDYGRLVRREGERPVFYVFMVELDRDNAIDWLTGLPGMTRFRYVAHIEADAIIKRDKRPAVVVFDLMGMKTYNAIYGREEGDRLLCTFASILKHRFGSELCCRYAGDSFCVLVHADEVESAAQDVFDEFARAGEQTTPPVMAGACELLADDELPLVIDRAKLACDSDRSTWESHLSWYTAEMRSAAIMRAYVLEHVDEAIRQGWIRPYYQGLVRAASGYVCGEEALARWIDPNYGFLSPAQFIPTLEESGLLSKLDLHIVDCVIADMQRKRLHNVPLVPVSVNVSLRDLGHVDLARRIARKMDEARLPHDLLCIEFTESAATTNPEELHAQIQQLHSAGFKVWMDDFGSGFSSLNNLGYFDFDLIKLDMGFLYERERTKSGIIIDGVIRAAKRMGLRTLAEGVETAEQARVLSELGCDVLQGYHYFKPQSLRQVVEEFNSPAGRHREPMAEQDYWNAVSSVSLRDLAANGDGKGVSESPVSELPAGVCEHRDGKWWMLRANGPMLSSATGMGVRNAIAGTYGPYESPFAAQEDAAFMAAIDRCRESGLWERVSSMRREGMGFQFYVSLLATCERAEAFLITSTPNLLGAALGTYGDVPVGYAVLRVISNDTSDGAADAVYVYANDNYRRYGEFGKMDLAGKSIAQDSSIGGAWLLPFCYRAAILGERVHEVVFSERAGHWLSFNVAPSPVEDCCVFAFTLADAEQREREVMTMGLETSDFIIDTADALNSEQDYRKAMNALLEAVSQVIHPERLYIYERDGNTMSNTFEWCAPGVSPQIDYLQCMPYEQFAMWEQLLVEDGVVVIADVGTLVGVDDHMYEHLRQQDIDRMLAVPLRVGTEFLGYLGADNYDLEERLDTRRLLQTVASFVATRIANQRLVEELERLRTHDALTGALNRRGIDEAMERGLRERAHEPLALALVDVTEFRAWNDLYGRDVGDAALRTLMGALAELFPVDAVIGRNGSDEALVALFGNDASRMGELLRQLMARGLACEVEGRRYDLPLSAGYARQLDGEDLADVYSRADEALFAAKVAGPSECREWDASLRESAQLSQLGFATRDLAAGMPLAMLAHRRDGELLFANQGLARLLGYERLADVLAGVGQSLVGAMPADDWRSLVRGTETLMRAGASAGECDLKLHVLTRQGVPVPVAYRARLVSTPAYGDVLYAYLVALA